MNDKVKIGDRVSLEEIEKAHITEILKNTRSLSEAATVLGIDMATLYRKRKAWKLPSGEELRARSLAQA